jgi:Tfp pilus assembly protein PilN
MRPVNLIPPEDRRGDRAPARTGAIPYALLGVLAVALFAIAAVTLANKDISDSKAEKASLEAEQADAEARADALAPYAEFALRSSARRATVTSLAQSRFDWDRVLRELSLVLPDDIWLTSLGGSASAEDSTGESSALAAGLQVPTLSIQGCGTGHEAVAEFIETLEDIDGVTRVGIASSERGTTEDAGSGASASCQTRNFIAKFDVAVAFDAASSTAAAVPPATVPEAATPTDANLADAQAESQQAVDSTTEQTEKARNAAEIVPGVAR